MLEKTFNSKDIEEKYYKAWEEAGIFATDPQAKNQPFTLMMPPPNVTGSLHMGHALNMTLQDILARYHRMRGENVLWQPGTDHAGIATQMVVERLLDKSGESRKALGREDFLKRVWAWKEESGGAIVNQLKRLGASPDWDRERFTMDEGLSKAVRKVFVSLYNENLIYRDKRLVNWDPKLHTSISDLEVEQKEKKGHLWHINYPIEGEREEFITVATTRPETLLGDAAVAVNPQDERYAHLIGKFAALPIADRLIPIIGDEYADPEHGSGAVKITPAHDFNDFEVGRRHDLPMISIFDMNACCNENTPENYRGLDRMKARKQILTELEEMDLIVKVEDIKHSVPHGDRSGEVIEPFLTDQWYCDAPELAKPAIKAVEDGRTVFIPENWTKTYYEWMRNIQPWCISRQLWWGHQIPAWYGPDGHVFVAETERDAQAQAEKYYLENPLNPTLSHEERESAQKTSPAQLDNNTQAILLHQDPDVLDTWFSAALWPFSTLGWPQETPELARYYPGDVLVTGFDIIFFWVARMMMMGLHFMGDVPFRTVYMHALVRDASGQKMSKSKGNVMDPLELIGEYSADALRFTMAAMAGQGRDIKLAKDRVEGYRNFTTKLWNAARYCEMNACILVAGFDPEQVKHPLNQWIIASFKQYLGRVTRGLDHFEFNEAALEAYKFVWANFCDWYLEFTKPILLQQDDAAAETRQTTAWVLEQILKMLHPFMPFMTEELYRSLTQNPDIFLMNVEWPFLPENNEYGASQQAVAWLIRCIGQIRSVRSDMNVPASAKTPLLIMGAHAETQERLLTFADLIKRMARVETIKFTDSVPPGSIQTVLDESTLIIPVGDLIDIDKERARLEKDVARLEHEILKTNQKLNNPDFMAKAPDDIKEELEERRQNHQQEKAKLHIALEHLQKN